MCAFGGKAGMAFCGANVWFDLKRTLIGPSGVLDFAVTMIGPDPRGVNETARVHHTSRRHDGHMADCGMGAETRADCADWCAHGYSFRRPGRTGSHCSVPAGPTKIGFDRRSKRAD